MTAPDWWLTYWRETAPVLAWWTTLCALSLLTLLCLSAVARAWSDGRVERDVRRWLRALRRKDRP